MITIEALRKKLIDAHARATAITELADTENRDLTIEEQTEREGLLASCEALEKEIGNRERAADIEARLDAPGKRKTAPQDTAPKNGEPRPRIAGGDVTDAQKGTGGFKTFGEFARAVAPACIQNGRVDQRLRMLTAQEGRDIRNAATTYASEGVGGDGGYQVPPDFRTQLLEKVIGEDSLLSYTDQQATSSNSITFPSDENTPWDTTNGIQALWEGEAVAPAQSKSAVQAVTVRANKIMALVPVTDELLEDAPSLEAYLRTKAPQKINFKVNDAIINGDGKGKPLGLMTSGSLVTVAAEGAQVAGTIVFNNIVKMWARMPDRNRRNAVWVINQDAEAQFDAMVIPGTQAAFPAYMPAGGLSGSRYSTLRNRQIVYTEACQALGTPGDIILWDPTQYLSVVKSGGLRTDVSIHLFFDQDTTAFRFVLRVGGQPWWKTPITRSKSALTFSSHVALAQR